MYEKESLVFLTNKRETGTLIRRKASAARLFPHGNLLIYQSAIKNTASTAPLGALFSRTWNSSN